MHDGRRLTARRPDHRKSCCTQRYEHPEDIIAWVIYKSALAEPGRLTQQIRLPARKLMVARQTAFDPKQPFISRTGM